MTMNCPHCETELRTYKPSPDRGYLSYPSEKDDVLDDGVEHTPARCRDILKAKLKEALHWEDVDDEWTSDIRETHPLRTGEHDNYALAMKMIGNRHSKGQLVELVNWLLSRTPKNPAIDMDAVEEKVGFPSTTGAVAARRRQPIQAAIDMAQLALRSLGKEDLIFSHHGGVQARPEAYKRLAAFFEQYADFRKILDKQASET